MFHKKVLGKLYPVPPRSEKSCSPKRDAEAAIEKPHLDIKAGKRPITGEMNYRSLCAVSACVFLILLIRGKPRSS